MFSVVLHITLDMTYIIYEELNKTCKPYSILMDYSIVGARSTVAERGTVMRVDAGSNPAQSEVSSAVVKS